MPAGSGPCAAPRCRPRCSQSYYVVGSPACVTRTGVGAVVPKSKSPTLLNISIIRANTALRTLSMSAGSRLPGTPTPMHTWRGAGGLTIAGDSWGDPNGPLVLLQHGGGQTRHAWKNAGV